MRWISLLFVLTLLVGCAAPSRQTVTPSSATNPVSAPTHATAPETPAAPLPSAAAPVLTQSTSTPPAATGYLLGDGKLVTAPTVGSIYACAEQGGAGGGADEEGPWIVGSTYYPDKKIAVQGAVEWPQASFSVTAQGSSRVLTGNGLPVRTTTGTFPISSGDPAYAYDRNPNSIVTQSVSVQLPKDPVLAVSATCVSGGVIGYFVNGVPLFDGFDAEHRDAVAHEVQDMCEGHPQQQGVYHYHSLSPCVNAVAGSGGLVGYALDGFGIYSYAQVNGTELASKDLDACHGISSEIEWDGKNVTMYHYVATRDFPYTIGCFRGTPVQSRSGQQSGGSNMPPGGMRGPPPLRPPQ